MSTEEREVPANNRPRVRALMPAIKAIVDAQIAFIEADAGREQDLARAKRNGLASSLNDDALNTARMFVASLGALLKRHI